MFIPVGVAMGYVYGGVVRVHPITRFYPNICSPFYIQLVADSMSFFFDNYIRLNRVMEFILDA
jgi:hypothetical protein